MKPIGKWIFLVLAISILICAQAFADRDEHHENRHHREHDSDHHSRDFLKPVVNSTYKETCGSCHLTYPPELLPSRSWEKIVASSGNHFGESFELDDATRNTILQYLTSNAANQSPSKRAVKIMRSLGDQTPLRITEIPYLRHKHHEIGPDIFKRKSIGSFSNCSACHKTADQGMYDDDDVVIPE